MFELEISVLKERFEYKFPSKYWGVLKDFLYYSVVCILKETDRKNLREYCLLCAQEKEKGKNWKMPDNFDYALSISGLKDLKSKDGKIDGYDFVVDNFDWIVPIIFDSTVIYMVGRMMREKDELENKISKIEEILR